MSECMIYWYVLTVVPSFVLDVEVVGGSPELVVRIFEGDHMGHQRERRDLPLQQTLLLVNVL